MSDKNYKRELAKVLSLMKRDKLHLNEFGAKQHINEIYKQIDDDEFTLNINEIPEETLRKQYVDYRLIVFSMSFDNPLHTLKEMKSDSTSEPLGVVQNAMLDKYQLDKWQFRIIQGRNGISVCVIIPLLGENVSMIETDMDEFGYFCSRKEETKVNDMVFMQMKFEPQFQENVSNIIRQYEFLYHTTLSSNLEKIMSEGLTPQNSNNYLSYPPRVFLIKGDVTTSGQDLIAQTLFKFSGSEKTEENYTILTIDVSKIPNNIPFYFDPNHEHGVFTNETIPYACIVDSRELTVFKK